MSGHPQRIAALSVAFFTAGVVTQAAAQDRPAALPTRDVDVTYRTTFGGPNGPQTIEQRSRFSAAAQRTRLDLPTPGLFSIMDYRAHTRSMISEPDRKVLQTASPASPPPDYLRLGQDQVAGLPCTEWQARDSVGQPAITCFTADGVMLRARRGVQVLAVATQVVYAPQAPGLFVVPPEFERVQRPASTGVAR